MEGSKYPKKLVILRYCGAGEGHEEHAGRPAEYATKMLCSASVTVLKVFTAV